MIHQTCYLALGANLGQPLKQFTQAIEALSQQSDIEVLACSRFTRSKALGDVVQPDYINGVVAISTSLPPIELLNITQSIENDLGRTRDIRWGPRTLDIDILLYGNEQICLPRLTVPHYAMHERRFVLQPLLDVAGDIQINQQSITSLINQLPGSELEWVSSSI